MTETPSDLFDVGWGHGFHGHTTGGMLARVRRELGHLESWQEAALIAGHAEGEADRTAFENDMRTAADLPPLRAPADAFPF